MTIINQFGELSKMDIYRLTANSMKKKGFKDIIDKPFKIKNGVFFEEEKQVQDTETGEIKTVVKSLFSITTDKNEIIGGDSKTIQNAWLEMYETFGSEIFDYEIVICQYESKSGRKFLQMELKQ